MTCPMCNTINPASAKFCMACGGELVAATPEPGHQTTQPVTTERPKYEQLLEAAFQSYERGTYSEAILAAEGALALEPNSSSARSLLGIVYEKKGDIRRAIEQFEKVVELNPNSQSDREKLEALRLRTVSMASKAAKSKLTESTWQRIASPVILGILGGIIVFALLWAIVSRGGGDRGAADTGRGSGRSAAAAGPGAPGRPGELGASGTNTLAGQPYGNGRQPTTSMPITSGAPSGGPLANGGSLASSTTSPFGMPTTSAQGPYTNLVAVRPPGTRTEAARGPNSASPKKENQVSLVIEESQADPGRKPNVALVAPSGSSGNAAGGGATYSAGQYERRGENYQLSGMYSEALGEYQKAFGQRQSWDLAQRMAMCHERLGQMQSAIDYYRRARGMAQSDIQAGRGADEARSALRSIDAALEVLGAGG